MHASLTIWSYVAGMTREWVFQRMQWTATAVSIRSLDKHFQGSHAAGRAARVGRPTSKVVHPLEPAGHGASKHFDENAEDLVPRLRVRKGASAPPRSHACVLHAHPPEAGARAGGHERR